MRCVESATRAKFEIVRVVSCARFGTRDRGSSFGEDAMTFTIHASRNDQSVVTVRISPAVAVDKARGRVSYARLHEVRAKLKPLLSL